MPAGVALNGPQSAGGIRDTRASYTCHDDDYLKKHGVSVLSGQVRCSPAKGRFLK